MLTTFRRFDADIEAALRRIDLGKLVVTVVVVWAAAVAVMGLLLLVNP